MTVLQRSKYQRQRLSRWVTDYLHGPTQEVALGRNQLWSWVDIRGGEYMQYVVDIRQGSIRHAVSGILAVAPLSPTRSSSITDGLDTPVLQAFRTHEIYHCRLP